jgi:Cofactor assembly of complex C subunit B
MPFILKCYLCLFFLLSGVNGFTLPSRVIRPTTSLHIIDPHLLLSGLDGFSSSLTLADEVVDGVATYSKASYYTVLGLYLMSFPGLWSQIKRSTTAKIKRKTYISPGENAPSGGKDLRQQAGEIMACE